jgi:hypothetical protein
LSSRRLLAIFRASYHRSKRYVTPNLALRHLGDAITTAQWLKLDSHDASQELPLDDPVLNRLAPWAAREVCKRLLHMLAFVETTTAVRGGRYRLDLECGEGQHLSSDQSEAYVNVRTFVISWQPQ